MTRIKPLLLIAILVSNASAAPSFFTDRQSTVTIDTSAIKTTSWLAVARHYAHAESIGPGNESFWRDYLQQAECENEPDDNVEPPSLEERISSASEQVARSASRTILRVPVALALGDYDHTRSGYPLRRIEKGRTLDIAPLAGCKSGIRSTAKPIQLKISGSGQWYPGLPVASQDALPDKQGSTGTEVLADLVVELRNILKTDNETVVIEAEPVGLVAYAGLDRNRILGVVGAVTASSIPTGDAASTDDQQSADNDGALVAMFDFPGGIAVTPLAVRWSVTNAVNVRSGPGTEYDVVASLQPRTIIESIGSAKSQSGKQWIVYRLPDGGRGFVSASFLRRN